MSSKLGAFLFCVVIVVGYAGYDYWNEKHQANLKSESSILLNWRPEQVSEIIWQSVDKEVIHLQRGAQGWDLVIPVKEPADSEAVVQFVEGLVLEKSTTIVKSGEALDLKIYGLDQPKITLVVKNNLGNVASFQISAKKNFEGEVYLRKDQEPRVHLVSNSWLQKAEHRALDFRDKRLARLKFADIESFSYSRGSERFSLAKKEDKWELKKSANPAAHLSLEIDQNKVRKFLALFSANHVRDFLAVASSNSSGNNSKPMIEVVFGLKDNKHWHGRVSVGPSGAQVLSVDGFPEDMVLTSPSADELYKVSLDSLRDRTEPFRLAKDDVRFIRAELGTQVVEVDLKKEQADPQAVANLNSAKAILNKISAIELADFHRLGKANTTSAQSLLFLDQAKKQLLKLILYGPFSTKVNGLDKIVYEASSSLVAYPFTIDESQWKNLDLQSLFTSAEKSGK